MEDEKDIIQSEPATLLSRKGADQDDYYLAAMTKSALRKLYRQKRAALTAVERMKLDDLLLIQFQKLSFDGWQTVLSYCPSDAYAEPNTHLFTRYLEHMIPGLRVCYPVTNPLTVEIKPMLVNEDTEFGTSNFGIEEPLNGIEINPEEIDVVFVPMLIYDKRGFRVGFGKGFYDRFLPRCGDNVLKIGFSYFEPVDIIEDTHQFDVPLQLCVTPNEVLEMQNEAR